MCGVFVAGLVWGVCRRAQIYCLSGKGKNLGDKAKVGGRFSTGKLGLLTSINAKRSQLFRSERLKLGRKGTHFCNISDRKVIFFRNFEPCCVSVYEFSVSEVWN